MDWDNTFDGSGSELTSGNTEESRSPINQRVFSPTQSESSPSIQLENHQYLERESSIMVLADKTRTTPPNHSLSSKTSRTPGSSPSLSRTPVAVQALFQSVLDSKDAELTRLEGICVKLRRQCDENKRLIEMSKSKQDTDFQEITRLKSIINNQSRSIEVLNEELGRTRIISSHPIPSRSPFTVSQTAVTILAPDHNITLRERYDLSVKLEQVGADLLSATRERDRYKSELEKMKLSSSRRRSTIEPTGDLSENQVSAIDAQWMRKLNTLKTKHEKIVSEYQDTIRKLVDREKSLTKPAPIPDKPDETRILKKRIQDLESRVESVKTFYLLKMKKQQNTIPAPVPDVELSKPQTHHRIVERLPIVNLKGSLYISDATISNPPLDGQTSLMTVREWSKLLQRLCNLCDLDVLRRLLRRDSKDEGISEADFRLRIGTCFDSHTVDTICSVYVSDDVANVDLFLSDLTARTVGTVVHLEDQIGTLKAHISSLMYELKDKIDCIESGHAIVARGLLSPQKRSNTVSETFKHSLTYNTIPRIRE